MKKLAVILTLLTVMTLSTSKGCDDVPKPTTNYIAEVVVKPPFSMDFYARQRGQESGGDNNAVSSAGARGIAQFMPRTWRYLKDINVLPSNFDIRNEAHQRTAQITYMNYLYYLLRDNQNAKELTIASYNAGIGRVTETVALHNTQWKDHLPLETKNYLKILHK